MALVQQGQRPSVSLAQRPALKTALLLAALLSGCGGTEQSCSGILRSAVTVRVVDEHENPVCDVQVALTGPDTEVTKQLTSESCFAAGGNAAGEYEVAVTRDGILLDTTHAHVVSGQCGIQTDDVVVQVATN